MFDEIHIKKRAYPVQRAPALSGVWGRVSVASLTLACAMRGDRDSNPEPSGHRRFAPGLPFFDEIHMLYTIDTVMDTQLSEGSGLTRNHRSLIRSIFLMKSS